MRFLGWWERVETRLAVWVICAEIVTLVLWVALKGLAAYYTPGGNVVGLIFRGVLGALLLGFGAYFASKSRGVVASGVAVSIAVLIGSFTGLLWANVGGDWASNLVSWSQNASAFMLIGGPRGLVTRLTLLVALLGGSLAAGKGKHINIDVATRYLPRRFITPVAFLGWSVAMVVCFAATFGFVDSIAVTKYRAEAFRSCEGGQSGLCDTPMSERLGAVAEGMSTDFFLLRRQIGLDLRTLPRVMLGAPYDGLWRAPEWNAWVKDGGWEDHFSPDAVKGLYLPEGDESARKIPAVVAPDTGEGRDLLIRDLNFILPFGLLMIGLKFLLRMLLVISGHVKVDPDAAHADVKGAPGTEATEPA